MLEVGKRYQTRDNEYVVTITKMYSFTYPAVFSGVFEKDGKTKEFTWFETGKFYASGKSSSYDLVSEVVETNGYSGWPFVHGGP